MASQEVPDEFHPRFLTLLGVELGSDQAAALNGAGEGDSVFRFCRDQGGVEWSGEVRVHVVEVGSLSQVCPRGLGRIAERYTVPAHMRNLQFASGKAGHLSLEYGKASDPGRLFASFKEELVSDAYSKEGPVSLDPVDERFNESKVVELGHAVSKGSLTGKKDDLEIIHLLRCGDEPGRGAEGFQRLDEAADVAAAVVDDADLGFRRQEAKDGELIGAGIGGPDARESPWCWERSSHGDRGSPQPAGRAPAT